MLSANDNAKAEEIAAWKEEVVAEIRFSRWNCILQKRLKELVWRETIESGKEYTITYVIDEKLNDAVGLELVTLYDCRW